jgi:hypothetical protein
MAQYQPIPVTDAEFLVTKDHAGAVITSSNPAGTVFTLPAAIGSGLTYKFLVETGNASTFVPVEGDVLIGGEFVELTDIGFGKFYKNCHELTVDPPVTRKK